MTARALGVCYYPEHWPEERWPEDARMMADLGLTYVRIGEFAWSRLEPEPGRPEFNWLARSIDTLHGAGLKVVLGTPTATPPKWLVDRMPDMLAVDSEGRARGFGSRRHYCFSHEGYRAECARMVRALAERFGDHPGIAAWQTDNEYGCHNTVLSYSDAALAGFRVWLAARYGSVEALNRAWGNVFWSMEYRDFTEIDLPNQTVAEAGPSHRMDFARYASDQVAAFNRVQTDIIRELSPGRPILHNYMGQFVDFDSFAVGADLDIAGWDSYPLGFLERMGAEPEWRHRFLRQGDPDFQAFHHDLYRAAGRGRLWVMEQQPGPVNWADFNPAPLDGMARLWAWEAFAHGAEAVCYFRWRQAPFAQEQMHAGILRPDAEPAPAFGEAGQVARELAALPDDAEIAQAPVALIFDYESNWAWDIQPQGRGFSYFKLVFETYRALRRKGLSIDILPSSARDFTGYKLAMVPGLFAWPDGLAEALAAHDGLVLAGPRTGSKTADFQISDGLPPGLSANILDFRVARVETLPPDGDVQWDGSGAFRLWREFGEGGAEIRLATDDGWPVLVRQGGFHYLAGWPTEAGWTEVVALLAKEAGLDTLDLPDGLRCRDFGNLRFFFNYDDRPYDLADLGIAGGIELDGSKLPPGGVALMRR